MGLSFRLIANFAAEPVPASEIAESGRMLYASAEAAGAPQSATFILTLPWHERVSRNVPSRSAPRIGCNSTAASPFVTRPRLCPTLPNSGSAISTPRRSWRRGPARPTATTSSTMNRLNPEIGSEEDFRVLRRCVASPRHGPHPRLRAQPHGRRRAATTLGGSMSSNGAASRRSPNISTSTGKPPEPDLRGRVLLPVLGEQYGDRPRKRRNRASVRCGARQLQRLVFRASPADLAAHLSVDSCRRRVESLADFTTDFAVLPRQALAAHERAAELKQRLAERAGESGGRLSYRVGAPPFHRPEGQAGELPQSASPARGPGVPRRRLARRRRGDQLPPLLQCQRACRLADGVAGGVRARPTGW